jgi:hypothetical protein
MKDTRFYYECVMRCQMGFMALDHRKERFINGQPQMVLHETTFYPEDPYDKRKPAMILALDFPLAERYVEEVPKMVRRKNLRTNEWEEKETHSKIKFRLMDKDEITNETRAAAVYMQLRDMDYATEMAVAK